MDGTEESTLRAKYLDWCSARLAERFLDLSPEEIYALARPGEGPQPEPSDPSEAAEPGVSREPAKADTPPTAESASPSHSATPPSRPPLPKPTDEGYRTLVQRVTEALLRRTSLPTFEQWAEAYADSPERFEAELLGFWKDVVGEE